MYYESELYHHGIKGQKWGKQNGPPYPLSRQQEKKVSKKYTKEVEKAKKSFNRNINMISLNANLAASNKTGPINERNTKEWNNFNKTYEKLLNQSVADFYSNNKHYQKAESLAKKYNMYSWSDIAKENRDIINNFRKGKGIKVNY